MAMFFPRDYRPGGHNGTMCFGHLEAGRELPIGGLAVGYEGGAPRPWATLRNMSPALFDLNGSSTSRQKSAEMSAVKSYFKDHISGPTHPVSADASGIQAAF